jgi:hypothetical protein
MDSILSRQVSLEEKTVGESVKTSWGRKCQTLLWGGREPGTTTWLKIFFSFFLDFFHPKEEKQNNWRARYANFCDF